MHVYIDPIGSAGMHAHKTMSAYYACTDACALLVLPTGMKEKEKEKGHICMQAWMAA